jgi:Lung seven transmembrane receptor
MMVEMLFIWFYYEYINLHGNNFGSRALLFVVAIMNAARGALSFFMLLIVCMGYSIVKYPLSSNVGSNQDPLSVRQCGGVESSQSFISYSPSDMLSAQC